jgi:hypothetical protein
MIIRTREVSYDKTFKNILRDFIEMYGDQIDSELIKELDIKRLSEREILSKMFEECLGVERAELDFEKDKAIITLTGCVRRILDKVCFEKSQICLVQVFGACIIEKTLGVLVEDVNATRSVNRCVLRFTLGEIM